MCASASSLPAVYSDWSILSELFLGFVHLSDEINEALSGFWHPLLGPVGELELADRSGLAILRDNGEKKKEASEQIKRGGVHGFCQRTDIELMFIVCVIEQRFSLTHRFGVCFCDLRKHISLGGLRSNAREANKQPLSCGARVPSPC